MPLKAKLNTLEGLNEAQAALYRAEGEFFVLDVEPVDAHELTDVAKIKGEIGDLRRQRKELERRVNEFEGIDLEAARAALAKLESHQPEEQARAYIEQEITKFTAAKDAELAEARGKSERYQRLATEHAEAQAIEAAARRAGFLSPKLMVKMRDVIGVAVQRKGDSLDVVPVDAHGRRRLVAAPGGKLQLMTLEDRLRELARDPEYRDLVKATPKQPPRGSFGTY